MKDALDFMWTLPNSQIYDEILSPKTIVLEYMDSLDYDPQK